MPNRVAGTITKTGVLRSAELSNLYLKPAKPPKILGTPLSIIAYGKG
jgi:hypothetical protein